MIDFSESATIAALSAVIAAVLSATIALIGSYISNRSHRQGIQLQLDAERDYQKLEIERAKIEELYLLVDKWLKTAGVFYLPYMSVMRGEMSYDDANEVVNLQAGNDQAEYGRIEMLIMLYFPSLLQPYEVLMKARDNANSIIDAHKSSYKMGRSVAREFIAPLSEALMRFDNAGSELKTAISKLTHDGLALKSSSMPREERLPLPRPTFTRFIE